MIIYTNKVIKHLRIIYDWSNPNISLDRADALYAEFQESLKTITKEEAKIVEWIMDGPEY